ncbi:hypothetical protein [Streptomyces klenkii]
MSGTQSQLAGLAARNKKLDAYASYVERIRTSMFLAVELYELWEGLREHHRDESEITADMSEAGHHRGRAFKRVMLLLNLIG